MNNLDSDPGAIIPQILLIIILTAINGFFASSEIAIVSVNKSKVNNRRVEDIKIRFIKEPSKGLI